MDLGFPGEGFTHVLVRRNGEDGQPLSVELHSSASVSDFLRKAGNLLKLENASIAYFPDGSIVKNPSTIESTEVITISTGGPFVRSSVTGSTGSLGGYPLQDMLGKGGFASVYRSSDGVTGEARAIKVLLKKSFRSTKELTLIFNEIEALRNLRHANIVRLFGFVEDPLRIGLVMEFCGGGELRRYVDSRGHLEEDVARPFFFQMASAVQYSHSMQILHRDLKLENVLLDGQGNVKIVDFGLSDFASGGQRVSTRGGTPAYIAPEVKDQTSLKHDPRFIDVWGLGVMLFDMTHGKVPVLPLVFRPNLSMPLRSLLDRIIKLIPEKRATVDSMLADPWLANKQPFKPTVPAPH